MKQTIGSLVLLLLVSGLFFPPHGQAQQKIPASVVGCGGAVIKGDTYSIVGTLGQPLIGVMTSPTNNKCIGFWHQLSRVVTGVDQGPEHGIPTEYRLEQNYPNPFNPSTTIRYGLPQRSQVILRVFTTLGQKVAELVNGEIEAGYHEAQFGGGTLASGVYLYRLQAGGFVQTKRLLLLK